MIVRISNMHAERVSWHLTRMAHSWDIITQDEHVEGTSVARTDAPVEDIYRALDKSIAVIGDRCSAIELEGEGR